VVVGEELLKNTLGLDPETYNKPGFQLLRHLGFTGEQIEQADRHACGTMTVEGAPHLKNEHYVVFDTASKVGRIGTRFIPWQAHIEMMAAVQPFVSGAISKTVNMPNTVSVEDVKGAYFLSWQRMLKAIAIYRDGSKLSQPLSSLSAAGEHLAEQILALQRRAQSSSDRLGADRPGIEQPVEQRAASRPAAGAGDARSDTEVSSSRHTRKPLPSRRSGYTQKAKIGGHSLFLRTGEYPDGSLGEIFLDMHREGAAFRSLLNSFAIAVSLGLQYGVPLEEYVDAFVFTRFEPNGIVQGHDNIKITTSVLDFIFRDLALAYLRRTDLVQVKPDDLIATTTNGTRESDGQDDAGENGDEAPAPRRTQAQAAKQRHKSAGGSPGGNGSSAGFTQANAPVTADTRRSDARSSAASNTVETGEAAPASRAAARDEAAEAAARAWETARMQGYEGDPCPVCGHSTLVRNGTCLKCLTCGSTTGCS
jgi:ribonucleoside-diphosphate reductase alpha chain